MDSEGRIVRRLLATGDPETLRTGLLSLGWPASVASEQAMSLRLGLDPAGIQTQIERLGEAYPVKSPGPYETLTGVRYGRRPSPRQTYRKGQADGQ